MEKNFINNESVKGMMIVMIIVVYGIVGELGKLLIVEKML
jgi:hypothetical protein